MYKIVRAWPMAGALFFLIYDNKFLLPWLVLWRVGPVAYFALPMAMCVVELAYFNWFFGWLGRWGKELPAARQAVDEFWQQGFGREVAELFPEVKSLVLRIWDWGHGFVQSRLQAPGNGSERWLARTVKGILKVLAISPKFIVYTELITLGIVPFGWVIGIPICRTGKARFGFAVLVLANMLSTALLAALGYGPFYGLFKLLGWL